MNVNVNFSEVGSELRVHLYGEVDHHTARWLREKIDSALQEKRPANVELDFSGVEFMDSSALALIIGRRETAMSFGSSVQLSGLSESQLKLVRLSGILRLSGIVIKM